jgi:hypothetical protein
MKEQVAAGERVLAYVDESGFAAIHPNRSAWTPKGERHLIDAKRGKRLNVMAALITTGGGVNPEVQRPSQAVRGV